MILGIQFIAIIFALIMIYFTHLYYKRENYGTKSYVLWLSVWIGLIIFFAVPKLLQSVTDLLNLQRITDLYTSLAIIFLITMTFYMYSVVKRIEKKMEKFVRSQAIKRVKKPLKKN